MKTVFGSLLGVIREEAGCRCRREGHAASKCWQQEAELRCSVLTVGVNPVCPMLPACCPVTEHYWGCGPTDHCQGFLLCCPLLGASSPKLSFLGPRRVLYNDYRCLPTLTAGILIRAHWWLLLGLHSPLFFWRFFRAAVYSTILYSSQEPICSTQAHKVHTLLYFISHEDTRRGVFHWPAAVPVSAQTILIVVAVYARIKGPHFID